VTQELIPTPEPAEMIERMNVAREVLLETLRHHDDWHITECRNADDWNAIDHVTHLTAWERSMVFLLTGRPRHLGLGVPEDLYLSHDLDAINAAIRDQHQGLSLAEALSAFDDVHQEMLDTMSGLTKADLERPYAAYLPDEPGEDRSDPVWTYIAGNTLFHYDEHRGWLEATIAACQAASAGP
jgi:hypothetical protein